LADLQSFLFKYKREIMELIKPGIGLLFWMLISFSVVFYVLAKFAWKPILHWIKQREKSIKDALLSAEKVKSEMAKLQADNEKIMTEARAERDKLLKEARSMKEQIIEEAKAGAQTEAQKVLENARNAINSEKKAAIKEIKDLVALLSLQVAEKIIKEKLTESKSQSDYIDKLLKETKLN
jgi:F-type H+-transporting ATPase subunit b